MNNQNENKGMRKLIRWIIALVIIASLSGCKKIETYTITFDPGGGVLQETTLVVSSTEIFALPEPSKHGARFISWLINGEEENPFTGSTKISSDITLVAKWENIPVLIGLVTVGEDNITYTIPINVHDDQTTQVVGGYQLAENVVTYALWYDVLKWALLHDFHFQNLGREGDKGVIGATPTDASNHPVTNVNFRDVIVWLNALSDRNGLEPVYQTSNGKVIKDARNANAEEVDFVVQTTGNGYRLPTLAEWQMAARWLNPDHNINSVVSIGGRSWLPGGNASGANGPISNKETTRLVSWYRDDEVAGYFASSHPVGVLEPNALGIYDMSGNVFEWCFDLVMVNQLRRRIIVGGAWYSWPSDLRVGFHHVKNAFDTDNGYGFRIAKSSE